MTTATRAGSLASPSAAAPGRVAIVSMGAIFPDAPDAGRFWEMIESGRCAARDVPEGRWALDPLDAFDPRVGLPDHVYSTRGCFVEGFLLDPTGLNLDPSLLDRLDPLYHLILHAGRAAWQSAQTDRVDPRRVGIVFGNLVLPTETASKIAWDTLGQTFVESAGLETSADAFGDVEPLNARPAGSPAIVLAEALGLGGEAGACTIDAACASSLYAIKLACDTLLDGRADAMIAGGASRPDPLFTQMGFAQLRALSPSGMPSPFGEDADGLVVGEGAGLFVLKRLEDALRQGDTVLGVIVASGVSNDVDGGLLAPHSEGQVRAMTASYRAAGWTPDLVDLIECHATGTPVGDAVEFESLLSVWAESSPDAPPARCVVGSVKSNVGHALTAAGASGLLKVLLAIRHETLPPTAQFAGASDKIRLASSPFRILERAEPWARRSPSTPRRAAISGFGFGGINAHLLIEEWVAAEGGASIEPQAPAPDRSALAVVGLAARFGPFHSTRSVLRRMLGGTLADFPEIEPEPQAARTEAWWGMPRARWFADLDRASGGFLGYRIDRVDLPTDRYRIPPLELKEMLPQQTVLLELAAEVVEAAGWSADEPRLRTGAIIGLELDPNATNFHVRWNLLNQARLAAADRGLDASGDVFEAWVDTLREASGPPLSPNRTMGALGSIVASRVAREFRLGGPSFTASSEASSGLHALDIACSLLRRGELDEALVGAIDMPGDPRGSIVLDERYPGVPPADGGAVLLLKRLDDAERDGDPIYAVVRGPVRFSPVEQLVSDDPVGLVDLDPAMIPDTAGSIAAWTAASHADVGMAGSAAGMASVVKVVACLSSHIIPPMRCESAGLRLDAPRPWIRDRVDGPRRGRATSVGPFGRMASVDIEGYDVEGLPGGLLLELLERPLGPRPAALFAVEGDDADALLDGLDRLESIIDPFAPIEHVARRWFRSVRSTPGPAKLAMSMVASGGDSLRRQIEAGRRRLRATGRGSEAQPRPGELVAYSPQPLGSDNHNGLAFVFPGMGNHFEQMGRSLAVHWPRILRDQDRQNDRLASQMADGLFWDSAPPDRFDDHRGPIFGQVTLGTIVADLLRSVGVDPSASVGYSLGETTAFFALGAWTNRDEMYRRFVDSSLFRFDLAGECRAARRAWRLADDRPVDWAASIVAVSPSVARAALATADRAYLLLINTDGEVVIGGQRDSVDQVVSDLNAPAWTLPTVSTVHCRVVEVVEEAYRDLHLLPTNPPEDIRFYSGSSGTAIDLDEGSAADSILDHALDGVDFPRVVRAAYADGVRGFVEVGPGSSCSRMIDAILADVPHLTAAACPADREPVSAFLFCLAKLVAERYPVDLASLYGADLAAGSPKRPTNSRPLSVEVGGLPFDPPAIPPLAENLGIIGDDDSPVEVDSADPWEAFREIPLPSPISPTIANGARIAVDPLVRQIAATIEARGNAHSAFLTFSSRMDEVAARQIASHLQLLRSAPVDLEEDPPLEVDGPADRPSSATQETSVPPRSLDRDACLRFAVGGIGEVLGPDFSPIDAHPTRVRLPDEPLMLVDRITLIEGVPKSMGSGRIVTEHDVLADAWYLDSGVIPTCIAVESGQADLFLSAFLGIDFETKGLAVYRLLDAVVTFHSALPTVGSVIVYDIAIDRFFRQGDSRLFRFRFEATVDGQPLMSMTDGVAGFFTEEALGAGRGVVKTQLDLRPMPGVVPDGWSAPATMRLESLDDAQVEALRNGDLVAAFGPGFANLDLATPMVLPGGLMRLVDRVIEIDPQGGRFGIGSIRAEADIRPDDWFMTCHFVDDQVMPGTLMYECCLHTLRIYLMRMGWVGEASEVVCQPVPGVSSRLKCRGQVVASTEKVTYEVEIRELGYRPEPYAIVDALMFADGKPIVEITSMSLRMTGLDRDRIDAIWAMAPHPEIASPTSPPGRTVLYDEASILAYAIGNPSEAFGDRYRAFDRDRIIARLPGPPYQFLDRIVGVGGAPWEMVAGARAVAEYDVPPDAWYFSADRQDRMPFAVLLEAALQPCGWLAAYMGSALQAEVDLSFRNLGGSATQHLPVTPETGRLTTEVVATKVSKSGGMIIHQYDMAMLDESGRVVYEGETTFGFFSKGALANQVGIREAIPYDPPADELARGRSLDFPPSPPFPDDRWRMIDRVDTLIVDGGPHGLGYARGTLTVDPSAWFFAAHFYQDPVVPGSLGLESFQQLLKLLAAERWDIDASTRFESVAIREVHRWTYRGQILPTDGLVTTRVVVTEVDDRRHLLRAEGFLDVDGRVIYGMKDFTLRLEGIMA